MEREIKTWQVTTADGVHTVEYHKPSGFKKGGLYVDGENIPLVVKPGYSGVDMPILSGGGHDIRFVSVGKNADIAYDGVYMNSGDIYEPVEKMSTVNWITTIISGFAGLMGGLLPWLCAIGGVALGSYVATRKGLSKSTRIILGILIAILTFVLAYLLAHFTGKGINAIEKNFDKSFGKEPYSIKLTQDFGSVSSEDDIENGYEFVFDALSDEARVFASSITEKKMKMLYGFEGSDPEEYLKYFWELTDNDILTTDSGNKYFKVSDDGYEYLVSVVNADGVFYETQMYCESENAEKMIPKMVSWIDSIKIAPASEG